MLKAFNKILLDHNQNVLGELMKAICNEQYKTFTQSSSHVNSLR